MAFPNAAISDIAATTIENRSRKVADNVTKHNAFLTWLKATGNVKTFSGGSQIFQEFSFSENANFGWYSGLDLLPVGSADVLSGANYPIKQCAAAVVISGLEGLQNSGREALIDLLEQRIAVAEATMANNMSAGLYSDGTAAGGKQVTGLLAGVADDPTSGTYGGIDRSQWPFWRNQVVSTGGVAAAATIQGYMNTIYSKLVRGIDRPKLILADSQAWMAYVNSLQLLQRFTGTEEAKLGFPTVKYMDSDVVLDGGIGGFMPSQRMYFLNPRFFFYRPHKDRDMVPLSPQRRVSINQDAEVQIIGWAGNATCSGAQFQGILRFA